MSRKSSRYATKNVSYKENHSSSSSDSSLIVDLSDSDISLEIDLDSISEEEFKEEIVEDFEIEQEEEEQEEEDDDDELYYAQIREKQNKKQTKKSTKKTTKRKTKKLQYTTTDVDEEHSITQGCFLVTPKKKKKEIKKENPFELLLNCNENETVKNVRYKAYKYHWNIIKKQIEELRENVYTNTFKNIREFVHKQKKNKEIEDNDNQLDILDLGNDIQLPTAVIIVGMNVLDHQRLLFDLVEQIETKNTYMITLQSKDCSSPSHALYSLITKCLNHPSGYIDESQSIPSSRNSTNIRQLVSWYKLLCKKKK